MPLNPYTRIRELERELELAAIARVKAEDETRLLRSQIEVLQDHEREARKSLAQKCDRWEDWMAALLRQPPIHGPSGFEPKPPPPPTRRPVNHGSMLEAQMMEQYEKDLGIDAPN